MVVIKCYYDIISSKNNIFGGTKMMRSFHVQFKEKNLTDNLAEIIRKCHSEGEDGECLEFLSTISIPFPLLWV